MAVDKALNQAPLGLDASLAGGVQPGVNMPQPDIEIEIEDPESVKIGIDGMEIELEPGEDEGSFNENLAEVLDEGQLDQLAGDLLGDYEIGRAHV